MHLNFKKLLLLFPGATSGNDGNDGDDGQSTEGGMGVWRRLVMVEGLLRLRRPRSKRRPTLHVVRLLDPDEKLLGKFYTCLFFSN